MLLTRFASSRKCGQIYADTEWMQTFKEELVRKESLEENLQLKHNLRIFKMKGFKIFYEHRNLRLVSKYLFILSVRKGTDI